ncbi:MAG TPA: HAD-IA family hydrolase [Patescibacteria group bacterium]
MISFVYFDVGGVVVRDFSASNKWDMLRSDLGIKDIDTKRFSEIWREYEKEICTSLPVDKMKPILEKEFGVVIPPHHSLLNNFIKYFDKNESIWKVVDAAKSKYKIGLLTSMYVGMFGKILEKDILPHVVWDAVIDSSIVGFAKPDIEIYEAAQKESGVDAKEILFIDNNMHNIFPAEKLGWQTFFYDSKDYEASSKKLMEVLS